jgi:hypothetical protein
MNKGGEIDTEGFSKPLGWGERRAIEQQHRNRADAGKTPGEVAEANLRRITTDLALKTPRFCKY